MSFNLNINDQMNLEIQKCAALYGITPEEFIHRAIMECLEDEYDLQCAKQALREYEEDPTTYTMEEVAKHLGIQE